MRFNQPPNWPPVPPGWTPPPGWFPDPSWPPPPPGWQLWITDDAPGKKKGLIIGGVIGAVLLVIAIVVGIVVFTGGSDDETPASGTTTTSEEETSDEDQIKEVIERFEKAWNDEDFGTMEQIICAKLQEDEEFNETEFLDARQSSGRLNLTINEIKVRGDKATANMEQRGEEAQDFDFVREDDEWKMCEL